jgi:hypothetical protein
MANGSFLGQELLFFFEAEERSGIANWRISRAEASRNLDEGVLPLSNLMRI